MFLSKSLIVDGIQIFMWGIAWLTYMENVGSMEDVQRLFNKMPS